MGYRTYIGWIAIEKYNKIKDLKNEDKNILYNIINYKEEEDECDDVNELWLPTSYLVDGSIEITSEYAPNINENGVSNYFNNLKLHNEFNTYIIDETQLLEIIKTTEKLLKDDYNNHLRILIDEGGSLNGEIKKSLNDGFIDEKIRFQIYEVLEIYIRKAKLNSYLPLFKDFWVDSKLNLDKEDILVSNSDYYEYNIYNLVYLYKSFDWCNKKLVWFGW